MHTGCMKRYDKRSKYHIVYKYYTITLIWPTKLEKYYNKMHNVEQHFKVPLHMNYNKSML